LTFKNITPGLFKKLFLLGGIAFLLFMPGQMLAQEVTGDTVIAAQKDTLILQLAPHSPKKAALYSFMLPGLGQYYNKKYWKMPIIYAGLIGLGIGIGTSQYNYNLYRHEYVHRILNDGRTGNPDKPEISRLRDSDLPILTEHYRKNRDLFIIGTLAVYLLNVVDATVDAHLFTFDVSEELTLKASPDLNYCFATQQAIPSLSLRLKF
jgi:hypothetical protein